MATQAPLVVYVAVRFLALRNDMRNGKRGISSGPGLRE